MQHSRMVRALLSSAYLIVSHRPPGSGSDGLGTLME
jgi:hypothetical protein